MTDMATLPVADLKPHPANRRDIGDITDLTASIKTQGVLEPLIVYPNGKGHLILCGKRRWAAATKAALKDVPCVIREGLTESEQLQIILVENLHRKDLSPLERAQSFQELIDSGLNQKDVAERVGVSQPTVSKSLGLLALPETIATKIGTPDGIPVDSVAQLTKLKDHPKALAAVEKATRGRRHDIDREVKRVAEEIARNEKVDQLKATAKLKSLKLVKEHRGYGIVGPYVRLSGNPGGHYGEVLDIPRADHRAEPCHAAYVPEYDTPALIEVCTNRSRHTVKGASTLKVKGPAKRKRSAHEQKELDDQKARKTSSARRADFLPTVLTGKVPRDLATKLIARAAIGDLAWEGRKAACALLGIDQPEDSSVDELLWAEAAKSDASLLRVALACVLARQHLNAKSNYHHWGASGTLDLYGYLEFMGYKLDDFEVDKIVAGKKDAQNDADEPDPLELGKTEEYVPPSVTVLDEVGVAGLGEVAGDLQDGAGIPVRTCRECRCTEDDACVGDQGPCTWVEDDLCSSCVVSDSSRLEQSLEQNAEDANTIREEDEPSVEVPASTPAPTATFTQKGRKHIVTCSVHGALGRVAATTDEFAKERWTDHLWEVHGIAVDTGGATYVEVEVGASGDTWKVVCSEHGEFPHPDQTSANGFAQSHIDGPHAGAGLIAEAELVAP